MSTAPSQAAGTSIAMTWRMSRDSPGCGPSRSSSSTALSSIAESEPDVSMTGRRTSSSRSDHLPRRPSREAMRFTLPAIVLISPLWQSVRNGWARVHEGAVFVE
jgi:hypothetical protein